MNEYEVRMTRGSRHFPEVEVRIQTPHRDLLDAVILAIDATYDKWYKGGSLDDQK